MPSPPTLTMPLWRCIFCGSPDLHARPALVPPDPEPSRPGEEFAGWLLRCVRCHGEYRVNVS